MLRILVLLLLLKGTDEKDILGELQKQDGPSKSDARKQVTSQTYVRASNDAEFIEVERIDKDGAKSYKVEAHFEPFEISDPMKEILKDGKEDLKITLKLKKTKIDGINKLKILGTVGKDKTKGADILFDAPDTIRFRSEYTLTGTAAKRKLQGQGTINLGIKGAVVRGKVQISDDGKELLIQNLNLLYEFKDIEISITGLQIEDMTEKQTNEFVYQVTKRYLEKNSDEISKRLSGDMKERLNRKLKGLTTNKVISMLKNP